MEQPRDQKSSTNLADETRIELRVNILGSFCSVPFTLTELWNLVKLSESEAYSYVRQRLNSVCPPILLSNDDFDPRAANDAVFRIVKDITGVWRPDVLAAPPKSAAFLMFLAFPRRHREATIGDLDEDYHRNVLPQFGRTRASIWYSYKALLYIVLYFADTVVRPILEKPYWRKLIAPALKYVVTPLFVAHRVGWLDKLELFLRVHKVL